MGSQPARQAWWRCVTPQKFNHVLLIKNFAWELKFFFLDFLVVSEALLLSEFSKILLSFPRLLDIVVWLDCFIK